MFAEHAHQLLDTVVHTRDNHLIKKTGLLELDLWSLDPESQLEHPSGHSSSGSLLPRSATCQFTMGQILPLQTLKWKPLSLETSVVTSLSGGTNASSLCKMKCYVSLSSLSMWLFQLHISYPNEGSVFILPSLCAYLLA